jgi:hypothetical protein
MTAQNHSTRLLKHPVQHLF